MVVSDQRDVADTADLDTTDFLILKSLDDHETALWKKRIHERQPDLFDESVSVQTVGRRVDKLHERELVETCIVSPDDIKRDLIIAFQLTDRGQQVLRRKRRELLRGAFHAALFEDTSCESLPELEKPELVELMADELRIDSGKDTLGTYDLQELVTILLLYFVQDRAQDVFTEERLDDFDALAADYPQLSSLLTQSVTDVVS